MLVGEDILAVDHTFVVFLNKFMFFVGMIYFMLEASSSITIRYLQAQKKGKDILVGSAAFIYALFVLLLEVRNRSYDIGITVCISFMHYFC